MCQHLVQIHEARSDKVIIFVDNTYGLEMYGRHLQHRFIHGSAPQIVRLQALNDFKLNPNHWTILISKFGDTSIDILDANVWIQVTSRYGSRRQEAQRLGRILRRKPRPGQNFNAFFYSLVSTDT